MFVSRVFKVLIDRRSYLFQYTRGTFLFYWAKLLSPLVLDSKRVVLGKNVRFQSIRNFLTDSASSKILIGDDSIIYENARLETYDSGQIRVGTSSVLGDVRISCREKITLGDRVLTSWNVLIQDFDPHPISMGLRQQQMEKMTEDFFPRFKNKSAEKKIFNWSAPRSEITIGHDVWIGANACILKGAHIGSGCVIATGSVVTAGHYAERSLLAGNPAKVIKELPL